MKAPDDNLVLKKERKPQKTPHAELHIGFQVSVWVSRIPMKPILRPQFPRSWSTAASITLPKRNARGVPSLSIVHLGLVSSMRV